MNEQTQAKIMQWIGDAAQKIGDFAANEVPPFIKEFLNWKFWECGVKIGITTIILIISLAFIKWLYSILKTDMKDNNDADVQVLFFYITTGFVIVNTIIFFTSTVSNVLDMIQIAIAPKVYLIEYASQFIKK